MERRGDTETQGRGKEERIVASRRFPLSAPIFILLGFIAYSTVINSYFLSDDFVQIGKVLEGDWSVTWAHETGGFFRPLFVLSCIVDARLWGENPFGYHLTNILLHAINSLLVYSLTLKLLHRQEFSSATGHAIALIAGLLFLLHPSHTETVSWITGRVDLLPTMLCLTAMLAHISYTATRRALSLVLALLAFALALLAKESAASLPFILFAAGLYFAPTWTRKAAVLQAMKDTALFFPILFLFILIRRAALGVWLGGYGAGQHLNFSPGWIRDRILQATLRATLPPFPSELSPILLKPLKSTAFILFALACAGIITLLLWRRRAAYDVSSRRVQNGLLLLLAVMFLFSLLPVINLRLSLFDPQGERFIYWPSVFTSIFIACAVALFFLNLKLRLALLLCVLIFYSLSLYRTNQTWREAAALSRSIRNGLAASAVSQNGVVVINAPANLRGVPVFHNGLEEALRLFHKNGRIERARVLALHNLQSVGDRIELKREDNALSLSLLNRGDEFTRIVDGLECVEILDSGDARSFRFRITSSCTARPELFFFSDGRMYRVLD